MGLAKNTKRQVPVMMVVDMNWAKRDVLSVNYSLIGMDYGALAVDVYFEQNLEQKK